MGKRSTFAAALAAGVLCAAGLALAGPMAIAGLVPGRWQLHEIGTGSPPRFVCVRDPMELIQLYHPGIQCTRFTIDDTATKLTIQYTCQARGYGRTSITVEDPALIRLETQGINAEGQPFDVNFEGRRVGTCSPPPRR